MQCLPWSVGAYWVALPCIMSMKTVSFNVDVIGAGSFTGSALHRLTGVTPEGLSRLYTFFASLPCVAVRVYRITTYYNMSGFGLPCKRLEFRGFMGFEK